MTDYLQLPKAPGVYYFKNSAGKVVYVGKARNLRERVKSYFTTPVMGKTAALVREISDIEYIEVESEVDAFLLEANQIRKLSPHYNITGKDGKNFPLIEINQMEDVPVVKIVRQERGTGNVYFGPYPTGSDIGSLLRYLRRVFPFVSQKHRQGRPCLYSHLGLCPCADFSVYPANLKNLKDFLGGKRKSLQQNLEREMRLAAAELNFEKAGKIRNKLTQIAYITSGKNCPWQYEQNPSLVADRKMAETDELKKVLKLARLERIEGYDISNTSGKLATGAMVTFINGVPEKKFYRRFKIKTIDSPDDFAMLSEMMERRLKSELPLPELMVIDGGLGQVSTIQKVLKGTSVTVIGVAKRMETIISPRGEKIQPPANSPALQLLQKIRDEAHRFSRKYHFLLRKKKLLS